MTQRVVLAITCLHPVLRGSEYEDYYPFPIPMTLMQIRYDGKIGFVAGHQDDGETPLQAVLREAQEEIGWNISPDALIVVDEDDNFFEIEVDYELFRKIQRNFHSADHAGIEVCGLNQIPLINYADCPTYDNICKHNFAGNAREQLDKLVTHKGWNYYLNPKEHDPRTSPIFTR